MSVYFTELQRNINKKLGCNTETKQHFVLFQKYLMHKMLSKVGHLNRHSSSPQLMTFYLVASFSNAVHMLQFYPIF